MSSRIRVRSPLLLLALAALLLAAQSLTPVTLRAAAPTLLFDDEFDGSTLNGNKWVPTYWWGDNGCTIDTNNELEWYLPDDALVTAGLLRLRAEKRTVKASNGKTYNYTSGVVTTGRSSSSLGTPPKFEFQYGYTEIRAKMPKGKGLWPAFWLLSCDQNWPPEIDVMEIIADQPNVDNMTLHYLTGGGSEASSGGEWAGPDFSAGWHTFGLDWQPNAVIWYVDGVERRRDTDPTHIPAESMYLLLNLAVGGDWPGAPDAATVFPAYYDIDYVRVWSGRPADSGGSPTPTVTATPTRSATPVPTATATPTRSATPAPTATRSAPPGNRRVYLPLIPSHG
jgi:beta-glucanase (GH16 family)